MATVAIEFGEMFKDFTTVDAFTVVDPAYSGHISSGAAEKSLQVFDTAQNTIRTLEFKAPVLQIQSCRHHSEAETDKIFILLVDNTLYRVT